LSESTQVKRYSQAIFEIAQEHNELEKWKNDLQKISSLAHNSELVAVMENPKYIFEDKKQLLDKQLTDIGRMALNLAYILTNEGNFSLITSISDSFQKLMDQYKGIATAEITTAIPIDEVEKQKLADRLGKIIGKSIVITEKVDPDIIGGIITRVDGKIIDGSTRSQLAALKNELVERAR
jgi:F-type H+-transporting ATPase subunit delta